MTAAGTVDVAVAVTVAVAAAVACTSFFIFRSPASFTGFDDMEAGLLIENEDVKASASDEDVYNEDAHGSFLCAV